MSAASVNMFSISSVCLIDSDSHSLLAACSLIWIDASSCLITISRLSSSIEAMDS